MGSRGMLRGPKGVEGGGSLGVLGGSVDPMGSLGWFDEF